MATLKAKGRLHAISLWAELCSPLLLHCPHKYQLTEANTLGKSCEPFLRLLCDDSRVGKNVIH